LTGTPSTEELKRRFMEFSEVAYSFSRELFPTPASPEELSRAAEQNLSVARTVFGKWSLEILVLLYSLKKLGFEQISRALRPISRRVLSQKLKSLERGGLVRRTVVSRRPLRVEYSLTEKGLVLARLGEPVFLYLRLNRAPEGPSRESEPA
jgi:DNA-binding HxlR family transcriptional regulator